MVGSTTATFFGLPHAQDQRIAPYLFASYAAISLIGVVLFQFGVGIAAERMDSSLGSAEARQAGERLRSGALRLLYVAPERFNNERFLEDLRRVRIGLFAVDEAHCISEWGHNFRPDYLKLAETAREVVGAERVLALTATATPSVVADICAGFNIPPECAIVTGFHRPNLALYTTPVSLA